MTAPLTAADVLTVADVAELLHMPKSTVSHLARTGALPSVRLGRRRVFLRAAIEAAVTPTPTTPTAAVLR